MKGASLPKYTGMEVTYELTQKDFYDSFIAHRNRNALSKWAFRLLGAFSILFLGLGLLGVVIRHNSQSWTDFGQWVVLASLLAGTVWVLPWWNARNQFVKQPKAKGTRTMMLDMLESTCNGTADPRKLDGQTIFVGWSPTRSCCSTPHRRVSTYCRNARYSLNSSPRSGLAFRKTFRVRIQNKSRGLGSRSSAPFSLSRRSHRLRRNILRPRPQPPDQAAADD